MLTPSIYATRPMTLFPMNSGEDNLMLDWTGGMMLNRPIHGQRAWWCKAGRLVGGRPPKELPLVRPGLLVSNPEGLEFAARSEQSFDPETGVLTTRIHFSETVLDCKSLLDGSCFLREVRVVRAPARCEIVFTLNDRRLWANGPEFTPSRPWEYYTEEGLACFRYHHEPDQENVQHGPIPGFSGTGRAVAWKQDGDGGRALTGYDCPRYLYGDNAAIQFSDARPGDVFTCGVVLLDTLSPDGSDHEALTRSLCRRMRATGFAATEAETAGRWRAFQERSWIRIAGHPTADHFFQLSRYAIKASQHPAGSIPCTVCFRDLGTSAYWDTWGPSGALARLNHHDEALQLGRFWAACLPEARAQARLLDAPGARLPWTSAPLPRPGFCSRFPQPQYHNIGVAIHSTWTAFTYTGDRSYLAAVYPLIEESATFLSAWLLQERGGEAFARAVGSLDENPRPRENDSWTLASALRVLQIQAAAAAELGHALPPTHAPARAAFEKLLRANLVDGTLLAYPGARRQSLGAVLPYLFHPSLPGFEASFRRYAEDAREVDGLGLGPYTHARARIFPWIQAKAAAVLAAHRQPGIWRDLLRPLLDHTDVWGGSPELWLHHREFSMSWYLGSHGFYLHALTDLIAAAAPDGSIDLLWGADPEWEAVDFADLRLPGGLAVRGRFAAGGTRELVLTNQGSNTLPPRPARYPDASGRRQQTTLPELRPGSTVALV